MTQGTSAHGGSLSRLWPDAGQDRASLAWCTPGWRTSPAEQPAHWLPGRPIDWLVDRVIGWRRPRPQTGEELLPPSMLSAAAGLAAGLMLTTAWHMAADAGAPLAILIASGAVATGLALRPHPEAAPQPQRKNEPQCGLNAPSRLLAQMHHELRTPLNAVIGFSEIMQHELHGPLGNARYQEYAAHISESGGRLLKASEDALAVAETMTVLLADQRPLRRHRLPAAGLVAQAWAALGPAARATTLHIEEHASMEIACDGRATAQALQHLLTEALACTGPGGAIIVGIGGNDGEGTVEIALEPPSPAAPSDGWLAGPEPTGDGLRLLLARSLIEMQGGILDAGDAPGAGRWSVRVALPTRRTLRLAQRPARPSVLRGATAADRRQAAPAHQEGFAAAAVARASARSRAAPPV